MRIPAAGVAALALSGCVTVFPKAAPSQLYRFTAPSAVAEHPSGQARFNVLVMPVGFNADAASDRILTVSNHQAAYIKGARWVADARSQFDLALAGAFDADSGPARLLVGGEAVQPRYFLTLQVRTFEADYLNSPNDPPTIRVIVHAMLSRPENRTLVGEETFSAAVPATENRGGSIATAFDSATKQTLSALAAWVDKAGTTALR